ncbi:endonuclease III [Ruminococcus sp.]|uniref:endonuclease III n=1 Tax=Ruminococcus sp. TaxID=41978 RepID=UPI0025E56AB7|nr:endonuclease III [Ruminococcus sp.]MBQ8965890.1 endonuclease III [Ruminococcus sp.]
MTIRQKKELAVQVIGLLEKQYPEAVCSLNYKAPHELLIATRLSAQCTDARVNVVTEVLFEKYSSIEEFAEADIADIEEIVKPCGLYKTKAKSIKEMCIQLRDDYGGILPDTLEELTKLSGIGRKTANLIMGDIYRKPAVVTDTHCIRITGRLGLVKNKEPAKVEAELWKILPPEKSSDLCHRLVLFGREFCTARSPKCKGCPLREICVSAGNNPVKN